MEAAAESFDRARRCLDAGDPAGARRWLERSLRQDPRHGAAWHLLGRLAADAGDSARALTFQHRSCAFHPDIGWNWFAAAELLEQRGEWCGAARHLEEASRRLVGEEWIARRARRARNLHLLGGEDPAGGLGPAAYRHWVRSLEPPLPFPGRPLRQRWWLATPAGWRALQADGTTAAPGNGDPPGADRQGWLLLLAPDALLRPGALQCLEDISEKQPADLLYPDEDRLDADVRRCDPWFKPDWVPESFWSTPWLDTMSAWQLGWILRQGLPLPAGGPLERWRWQLQALRRQPRIVHAARILVHGGGRSGGDPGPEQLRREQRRRGEALLEFLRQTGENPASVVPATDRDGGEGFLLEWALPRVAPAVRIVIPSADRPDLLDPCLAGIEASRGVLMPHVVVIDHASRQPATALCLERWRTRLGSRIEVLRADGDFHWSRFSNRGAAEGNQELLLFLNDDVEALDRGWLETMAAQALRPPIGCVGALLLYPDGRVQHAGMVLGFGSDAGGRPEHAYRGLTPEHGGHRGRIRRLSGWAAVTGACLMVRRAVFDAAGGFDERFPVEGNDVDFCLRLGALGYRHVVDPSARLLHRECQSRDPLASPTAAAALSELRRRHHVALASAGPWWPAACSTLEPDGRPRELAGHP